jgi:hypothetical protein
MFATVPCFVKQKFQIDRLSFHVLISTTYLIGYRVKWYNFNIGADSIIIIKMLNIISKNVNRTAVLRKHDSGIFHFAKQLVS